MRFQRIGCYQVTDNFVIDGTYTVQLRNEGNFVVELTNMPAISSAAFDYPEITPENRYYPMGRLDGFQRHKMRVWGIYNLAFGRASMVNIGGIWATTLGSRTVSGPRVLGRTRPSYRP